VKHGNVVPTLCGGCGKEVPVGTGVYVAEADGVRHLHAGPCAKGAGAVPGGTAAVWGERGALASYMIAHTGTPEAYAAFAVRYKEVTL